MNILNLLKRKNLKKIDKQIIIFIHMFFKKKINIYKLKSEFDKNYKTNTILNKKINKKIIDINIIRNKDYIFLKGKGTFILRKIKDIDLIKEFINNRYLPRNYNNKKKYREVYWNKKYGYIYKNNNVNNKNIKKLEETVNNLNIIYDNYVIDNKNLNNNNYGIIGIDTNYIEPKWLNDIIRNNNKFNPIITEYNEIIFSKSTIDNKTIEASIKHLKNKTNRFDRINPIVIYIEDTSKTNIDLDTFINSKFKISMILYDYHTRVIYKNNNKLFIIDPWKKTKDKGTKNLLKNYEIKFIKREKEQTIEGSCTAIAFARSLQMADKGVNKINLKLDNDYIILVDRLISRFRNK